MNQKVDMANHLQYNSRRSSNTELIADPGEKRVEILTKTFLQLKKDCLSSRKPLSHRHKNKSKSILSSESIDKGKENLKTYQRGKIEYQKLDKQQPSHKQQQILKIIELLAESENSGQLRFITLCKLLLTGQEGAQVTFLDILRLKRA